MALMETGDKIKVILEEGEYTGILMPSFQKEVLIIKLDNGYNIGIEKKKIKKMVLLEKRKIKEKEWEKEKEKERPLKSGLSLPLVSLLHCGGTIASKVDYGSGAVKPLFTPKEIFALFPELKNLADLKIRFITNIFSEDIRFAHYNLISRSIAEEIKDKVDGVVITHGTDTLHYTAAALAFALENLGIPVILVGSQRSSDRGSSDAFLNLYSALKFIKETDFSGVAVCLHKSANDDACYILPAGKTRKLHASRRDAFKPVNDSPIAEVSKEKIIFFKKDYPRKDKNKKLVLRLFNQNLKIGILRVHPQMFKEEISAFKNFDGVIIEGTGLGHLPVNSVDKFTKENSFIFEELKKLSKKIPLVMTSQTVFGRINMMVYSTGRKLLEAGVLGNYSDMTTETAFIKLAWLLSNFKKEEVKNLFSKNFRGEISEKTESDLVGLE